MSFDKYYPNRKDWRKPYRKAKAIDRNCRNHGRCPYCEGSRVHSVKKRELSATDKLNDIPEALHKITDEELLYYMIEEPDMDWEYLDAFTLQEFDEIDKYIANKK